jgi:hypothetical protein
VCRCNHREPVKYIDQRVHSVSGIPVDSRFIWRGQIGGSRVPDTELVAAVRGCAGA